MIKIYVCILLYWGIFFNPIKAQTVAVSAEKYHILYIGIENPVTIAVEGVLDENIKANITSGNIKKVSRGHYIITVSTPGETAVNLEWNDQKITKKFRVKMIPDPQTVFIGCNICRPEGVGLTFNNHEYEFGCSIQSFIAVYTPKRGDPIQFIITGSQFSAKLKSIIERANIGDMLTIINIKARCSGDIIARELPSLTYIIKG